MFIFALIFSNIISIYLYMYNDMGAKVKFSDEQKKVIVEMYTLGGCSIPEIIERCNVSKQSIYLFLKENNVRLVRKLGVKHNLVGKRFGYLTVLKMAQTEKSGKFHQWRAICSCSNCGNNNLDVNPQSLLRGQTTSCGCSKDRYIKMRGNKSSLFTGYEELNGKYWGTIKNRAEKRGYSFNLDIVYAWNLFVGQNRMCALSGLPITFAISNKKSSETTASLDRIDSNLGYVEGNVQWVHKHINIMKNVYSQDYFISLCKLISEHNG